MVRLAQASGPVPVAVAAAHHPEVLHAVQRAQQEGLVEATLIGDGRDIESIAATSGMSLGAAEIVHIPDAKEAARSAVSLARQGKVTAVVKGQVRTSILLKEVLNRQTGIRRGGLLSHVGLFEVPAVERLIYISDSGVVMRPDVYQKLEIIKNVVEVAHSFGLKEPKVAILAATDAVHPKIPASIDALALTRMAKQGWVEKAIVDGPLGLELAISPTAADLEGCQSPIAGCADVLIVPGVEAGNIVAKGLQYFAGAQMAGLVVGAKVPVIVSSRADTAKTRYLSLAMAAALVTG
jgi:phosphate butyryltransferase